MSTEHFARSSLSATQANVVRMNKVIAHALPHPDETWTKGDVPDYVSDVRRKLSRFGVIEIVTHRNDSEDERNHYRTKHEVYHYVHENLDQPRTLPCGHSGLRNILGGDYGCQYDECDAEFDRETVEEVYWA